MVINNKIYIAVLLILNLTILNGELVKSKSAENPIINNPAEVITDAEINIQNEDKSALVKEDPINTQNYNDLDKNFDFSKYENITLKKVILETLAASNNLKAANEKLIQTRIAYGEGKKGYLPTVNFALDTKVEKRYAVIQPEIGNRETKVIHDQRYKITIDQPLYSGGSTDLKIKTLKAKYQAAKNKYQIVLNQTIQTAIKAYFTLLFDIENVNLTSKNMEQLKKILDISQVKYDSGAISAGDLAAIKAGVANAQTQLNTTRSKLADSMDYYLYLLNNRFENTKPFEKNFTINVGTYEELKQTIINNNLSLINYRLNIEGTKHKLKSFQNKFKPKIDLQMKMSHILNQEDYIDDEQLYTAKISFRYNIYNKGADMNSISNVYSTIEELQYRYQEEIKKISWDTSKLYNSIKSLTNSLKSTKDEITASKEMVDVYWEGFQLGEQDLQVLLQGQRQLNTAQTNLLKLKKDYLTNMFKVLNQTNELASFFGINYEDTSFIDFTNVEDQKITVDMNNSIYDQLSGLKPPMDNYLELIQEYTFDDIVSFKDKFLQSDDNKYTIVVSDFKNTYDAYTYLKLNRLISDSFTFDYYKQDGMLLKDSLKKKVKIATKVSHGIFDTKEDAQEVINDSFNNPSKQITIAKVKDIKQSYISYVDGLTTYIDPYVIKPIKAKKFQTNKVFKKKFLNANKDYFTINIVSLSSMKKAEILLQNYGIENDSFVFKYGRDGKWVKVMYGVFKTYSQAFEALNNKPDLVQKYHPVIEKISHKQELYKKYEEFNIPKVYKTKVVPANKKDIQIAKKVIDQKKKKVNKKKVSKIINSNIVKTKDIKNNELKKIKILKDTKESEKENITNTLTYKYNNKEFMDKFLSADPDTYYTTNMALFTKDIDAYNFVKKNNIEDKTITVPFIKNNKEYYKVMYGLYKNKKEAKEAISKLSKNLKANRPTIEGVLRKQILFKTGDVQLSKNAYKNRKKEK